jgi:hypothetical protein
VRKFVDTRQIPRGSELIFTLGRVKKSQLVRTTELSTLHAIIEFRTPPITLPFSFDIHISTTNIDAMMYAIRSTARRSLATRSSLNCPTHRALSTQTTQAVAKLQAILEDYRQAK